MYDLQRWLDARGLVLKYFFWLFRKGRGVASLPQNQTHENISSGVWVKVYAGRFGHYLEYLRHGRSVSADWYRLALTLEYIMNGTDSIAFTIILSDYLRTSRRAQTMEQLRFSRRMVERWKDYHTFRSPFGVFTPPRIVKEIEELIRQIRTFDRRSMSMRQKLQGIVGGNRVKALEWKPFKASKR